MKVFPDFRINAFQDNEFLTYVYKKKLGFLRCADQIESLALRGSGAGDQGVWPKVSADKSGPGGYAPRRAVRPHLCHHWLANKEHSMTNTEHTLERLGEIADIKRPVEQSSWLSRRLMEIWSGMK